LTAEEKTYFLGNGLDILNTSFVDHLARLGIVLGGLDSEHDLLTFAVDTNSALLAETNALGTILLLPSFIPYE